MKMMQRQFTRKEMLALSVLASAALIPSVGRIASTPTRITNRIPQTQLPKPFQVPFATPPDLEPVRSDSTTDYYQVTMKSARVQILPGYPSTEIYGYNGITPGPTIRARRGRRVVVRQINTLPSTSRFGYETTASVHLHGNASPPQYDGYANDLIKPGYYKDYVYPNDQNERALWYHDHAVHHTAENAYMGLAGFYITDEQTDLPIPRGKYDVPLVIKDAIFGTDGQLIFDDGGHSSLFGDVILANGKPWPVMKVERRKYRFRVLNASVSRSYKLALSSGEPLTVIGTDAGLMPVPQLAVNMRIGMAERYEIVIDFSKYQIGQQVILQNLGPEDNADYPSTAQIMRFDVASDATDDSNNTIPATLNTSNDIMKLTAAQALRTRNFNFERHNGEWTINGLLWDPNRVDANPGLNDVEIWQLANDHGGWFHPVHIHLIDFRILDRNGLPPFPYELGPKDVVYVGAHETVRVIASFGPRTGRYMMHCHNLVHEDHDMMTQFEVGQGGPNPITAAPPQPLPAPPL